VGGVVAGAVIGFLTENKMLSYEYAKRVFEAALDPHETSLRTNPITGALFCTPQDSLKEQIELARRALTARAVFKFEVRWVGELLPLSRLEWDSLKENSDYRYIVGAYGQSLASRHYNSAALPYFDKFVAGVLALPGIGQIILSDWPKLGLRYPPKALPRLDWSGFYV
jgi:hypothetical protein